MGQYVTQPAYNLSNSVLLASVFSGRNKYKVVSQSLDNEADVNALKWTANSDNQTAIIVVLIIIAVAFVVFKYVKL